MITFKKETPEQEDHRRFFVEKGDPGFSPERNKYIVERSIKKNDELRKRKQKEYDEKLAERADAVYRYIRYLDRGGSKPVEKWLGRRWLAYMRGKQIVQTLMKDGRILLSEVDGDYLD